jgi:FAD/FMN-containing dehydrogenase
VKTPRSFVEELRTNVQGPVSGRPGIHLFSNFGGYAHAEPTISVESTCEADTVAVLQLSRRSGIPVTVRGAGHSSSEALAIARGGILLVNAIPAIPDITIDRGMADIEARARWHGVERRLNAQGVASRVLPDSLSPSVGGTISVGGFGTRSVRWGAQVDNVASLRMVLPDGTVAEAGPHENADLFRFALAGLGAVGVIERVRFRTMPRPALSRVYTSAVPNWHALLNVLGSLSGMDDHNGFDALPAEMSATLMSSGGGYLRRRYYFDAAGAASARPVLPWFEVGGASDLERSACYGDAAEIDRWVASFPRTHKVWADYLLDYEAFVTFVTELEQRVLDRHPGHVHLPSVYVLAIRTPEVGRAGGVAASALSPLTGATGRFRFGCGLYHMVPEQDRAALDAAIDACRELTARCVELGGRPYLHGVPPITEQVAATAYGADYAAFWALRRRLDPDGLLNPGVWPRPTPGHDRTALPA